MGIDAPQVVDIFVICVKIIINIINKKATMSLSAYLLQNIYLNFHNFSMRGSLLELNFTTSDKRQYSNGPTIDLISIVM